MDPKETIKKSRTISQKFSESSLQSLRPVFITSKPLQSLTKFRSNSNNISNPSKASDIKISKDYSEIQKQNIQEIIEGIFGKEKNVPSVKPEQKD